jgi:hypothetical protein
MDKEKRSSHRRPSFAEVTYVHLGVQCQGRLSDISTAGLFIDTINPLPEGSLLAFRFVLPGDNPEVPITGEGTVAWLRPMEGMGIRFRRLAPVDEARISAFLSRR